MEEIIFPNQLRTLRRLRGKPMKKVAEVLGVSLSAVSKIEKGYRRLDKNQIQKISAYLECPASTLLVTKDNAPPEVINAWKTEQDRRVKMNQGFGLKTLGAGLRYLRGQKGLSLQEVSKSSKLTLSVYHRIEMGQREVDEKTLQNIAHALGYSETDLQLKIYELDAAGSLDGLKKHTTGQGGLYLSKGGYNDLPVTYNFNLDEKKEIDIPVYGITQDDGTVVIDKNVRINTVVCPSSFKDKEDLYALPLSASQLGGVLPEGSVLVVSPNDCPKEGDMAVYPISDNHVRFVSLQRNENADCIRTYNPEKVQELSEEERKKLQKIICVMMI